MGKLFPRKYLFLLILLLFCLSSLSAYQLSPLSVTYQPTGTDSVKAYTITNDSDSPIAIEMKVYKRFIDEDGNEYTEEAPAYFSVQPSKMIIRPQTSQIVRVQYRGPRTVTKEMSFRIVSEQIAYSQGASVQQGSQTINFLFVYSTAAYVAPSRVVESVSATAVKQDGNLKVTVANTGSVHQMMNSLAVTVKGNDGSEYSLSEAELEGKTGVNLLTDSSLVFTIPMPEVLASATSYTATASYDYSY